MEEKYLKYKNKYINEKKQLNSQRGGNILNTQRGGTDGEINDFIVLNFNVTQFEKTNPNIIEFIRDKNDTIVPGDKPNIDDKKIKNVSAIPTDKLVDTFRYVSLLGADEDINKIGQHIISLNSDCIKIPHDAIELAKIKTSKEGFGGHMLASLFIYKLINTQSTNIVVDSIHFLNPIKNTEINEILLYINTKLNGISKDTPLEKNKELMYYDMYLSIITNNIEYLKNILDSNIAPFAIKTNMLYLAVAYGCDEEARLLVKYIMADNNFNESKKINIISTIKQLIKIHNTLTFYFGGHIFLVTYIVDLFSSETNVNLSLDKLKINN